MRCALASVATLVLLGLEAFTAWLVIREVPDAGYVLLMLALVLPMAIKSFFRNTVASPAPPETQERS